MTSNFWSRGTSLQQLELLHHHQSIWTTSPSGESQEQLMERLVTMASATIAIRSSQQTDSNQSKRLCKSPKLLRGSNRSVTTGSVDMVPDNTIPTPTRVVGGASIFTSFLGVDLTKCMLVEPTGLIDIDSNGSVPRLLVDTSGDCAIAINPSSQFEAISVQHGGNSETKKTSNLVQFLAPRPARLLMLTSQHHFIPCRIISAFIQSCLRSRQRH